MLIIDSASTIIQYSSILLTTMNFAGSKTLFNLVALRAQNVFAVYQRKTDRPFLPVYFILLHRLLYNNSCKQLSIYKMAAVPRIRIVSRRFETNVLS